MGKLEEEVRKEIRRTRINSAIVTTLAVSGGLAVAVMAPNVLGALGRLGFTSQQRQNVKKSFSFKNTKPTTHNIGLHCKEKMLKNPSVS